MTTLPPFVQYLIELLLVVWFLAAIANRPKRGELKEKLSDLVTTPSVYKEISGDVEIDLYPRNTLESAADGWRSWFVAPVGQAFSTVKSWYQNLLQGIFPENSNAWKAFNYFIILLLFWGYLYADAITVINTLESFGLVSQISDVLKNFGISILFGSLISIVLGGVVAADVFARGDFTDWGLKKDSKWIGFAKFFSIFLILSGLYVVASLGAARFGRFVTLDPTILDWFQNNGQFVINILTPINAGIATALIADDAFNKGLRIIGLAMISALVVILAIAWYLLGAIYGTVVYIIDVFWRFMLGVGNIIFFLALTPLDEVVDLVKSRYRR